MSWRRTSVNDQEIHAAVLKVSPPAIAFASGITLNDWVAIVTIIYVIIQGFFLLRDKWWRDKK